MDVLRCDGDLGVEGPTVWAREARLWLGPRPPLLTALLAGLTRDPRRLMTWAQCPGPLVALPEEAPGECRESVSGVTLCGRPRALGLVGTAAERDMTKQFRKNRKAWPFGAVDFADPMPEGGGGGGGLPDTPFGPQVISYQNKCDPNGSVHWARGTGGGGAVLVTM